jgi:hypothetical protein
LERINWEIDPLAFCLWKTEQGWQLSATEKHTAQKICWTMHPQPIGMVYDRLVPLGSFCPQAVLDSIWPYVAEYLKETNSVYPRHARE